MFILFVELIIWVLSAIVLVTQVVVPMIRNLPVFPMVRNRRKIEAELRLAREEKENAELAERVEQTRKETKNKKKRK